jgi:hypothetical protein
MANELILHVRIEVVIRHGEWLQVRVITSDKIAHLKSFVSSIVL